MWLSDWRTFAYLNARNSYTYVSLEEIITPASFQTSLMILNLIHI